MTTAINLLEERLKEFNLPAYPYQPAFDRIVVYMLPEEMATRETFAKDGLILKAETTKARDKNITPRAILLAAGLGAMDYLRSQAIGLGHILWIARLSPWRHVIERTTDKGDIELMFLRAGDVVGSEDVLRFIADGRVRIKVGDDGRHQYVADDEVLPRFDPPDYSDM